MSKMSHSDAGYTTTITLEKSTGTVVTLDTYRKYLDGPVELTLNSKTDLIASKGGGISNKGATALFSNMSVSSTNTSGVEIQTQGAAGREAILFNGNVDGWVQATDGDLIASKISQSTWNGTKYYATGVTLTNGKQFDITVPNGSNSTITFHFSVDNNGNTTITGGD